MNAIHAAQANAPPKKSSIFDFAFLKKKQKNEEQPPPSDSTQKQEEDKTKPSDSAQHDKGKEVDTTEQKSEEKTEPKKDEKKKVQKPEIVSLSAASGYPEIVPLQPGVSLTAALPVARDEQSELAESVSTLVF